ncbi:MAG: primosomal protein N' (replication factor Y) - superfamily II helicase, partial [Methylotetracoccus sp.]
GGDQQIIERMEVEHSGTTFKHVLLPVWVAAFNFVGRQYRFVVNGRTGEVHGERPWSAWKIAGAVALAIVLFLLLALLFSQAEALQQSLR